MHQVGFTIEIYHDARSHEHQIYNLQLHALWLLKRVVYGRNFRLVFGKFTFKTSSWSRMVLTGDAALFIMSKQV
jgi:hypothetical protein